MDDPKELAKKENLSVWSCDPKDIKAWTKEDIQRITEVLEKYVFTPNREKESKGE